jgi:hypothetical protein
MLTLHFSLKVATTVIKLLTLQDKHLSCSKEYENMLNDYD